MKSDIFCSIDVETANDDSTICQIGIVKFEEGKVVGQWSTYVNPETDYFMNTYAHHIVYDMVKEAPTFDKVYPLLLEKLQNQIVIHHMPFVKSSLRLACEKYGLPVLNYEQWLDSAKVLRRTFPEFARAGYGLFNVAAALELPQPLKHHDALQDAVIVGRIALKCIQEKNANLSQWPEIIQTKITPHQSTKIEEEGNPDGELYGETIVFTGTLSMQRKEAAKLAAETGCSVKDAVTKETTILVIGVPNLAVLKDDKKSSKQRKAEKLIAEGNNIRIMYEQDFINLLKV